LLLIATVQGIATLVASGRVGAADTDALIADTVTLFTREPRLPETVTRTDQHFRG
jgi:hypothetical protein